MKLKQIDLYSFRVYEGHVKFDFTCQKDKIADLVVIYGPNGFGKTSFTDAIEWAFTSEISRISKNEKLISTMNLDKKNTKDFLYILKNRKSDEVQGTMQITNDSNEKITLKTKKLDRRMKSDYDCEDSSKNRVLCEGYKYLLKITPASFRMNNLITSDAINSFLQFDDPEERYRILAKFWDEKEDTVLYEKVNNLTDMLFKRKEKLKEQIKDKDYRLKKILKDCIDVSALNSLILEFNKYSKMSFKIYDENASDFDEFKSNFISISEELNKERTHLFEIEKKINYLNANYIIYKKNFDENNNLIKQKDNNNKIILLFDYIDNFIKDLSLQSEYLEKKQHKRRNLLNILCNKKEYEIVIKNVQIFNRQIKSSLDKEEIILTDSNHLMKFKEESSKKLISLIKAKKQLENYIKAMNEKLELNKLNNIRQHYIHKVNMESGNMIERYKEKISFYGNQNIELMKYLSLTIDNICDIELPNEPNNIQIKYLYWEIIQVIKDYKLLKNSMNLLTKERSQIEEINKRNERVIELGLSIIEGNELNNCPLCGTPFKDLSELVNEIKQNPCFNHNLIKKSEQIQQASITLNGKHDEIKNLIDYFKRKLNLLINRNNEISSTLNINKEKVESNIRILNDRLKIIIILQNETKEIIIDIEKVLNTGLDINFTSDIIIKLRSENNNLDVEIKKSEDIIDHIDLSIKKNQQLKLQINNDIEILKNNKDKNLNSDVYRKVDSILKELNKEFNKSQIINNIVNFNSDINILKLSIVELHKKIANSKLLLKNSEKNFLLKSNSEIDGRISTNIKYIENYKVTYLDAINKFNNGIDIKEIDKKKNDVISKKSILETKSTFLNKISCYIELVNINTEKDLLQKELREFNIQKNNIDEKLKRFENLRVKIEVYLSEKIQNAFNLETINYIYKRIDPHPEFNEIKFVPDFKDRKPKIYIHAINDKEELSPVLYFSSAQVSILSLSIFLAKALLKSTFLDTIFMDDPIQHLDSINVLSFIDLLRTIITHYNIKKQIVITTNNDMFYRLLKMKLDNNYYNSNFIELKSYGEI